MMLLLRCPQKACVVAWAGNVVPSPYSAISGYHDGDLVSLTRCEVNAQNASMKSAHCSLSRAFQAHGHTPLTACRCCGNHRNITLLLPDIS